MNAVIGEQLIMSPGTLAFFLDDSGDQKLGDPANPLFALGGVSVMGADFPAVTQAWRQMTAELFGGDSAGSLLSPAASELSEAGPYPPAF